MATDSLHITKPKYLETDDFDLFTFWKGEKYTTLSTIPYYLTADIFEMGVYKAHQQEADSSTDFGDVAIATRQEVVHATYHRRTFHHFHRNNVRFKYTRLWTEFMQTVFYKTSTLDGYIGIFEYSFAVSVYETQVLKYEEYAPHLNNPVASILMWHCLEEAEHAYCFVNTSILERSKLSRFFYLTSSFLFHFITYHIFIAENLHLFSIRTYIAIAKVVKKNNPQRSLWNLVFGSVEAEKAFMLHVSKSAREIRQLHGI